MEMGHSCLQYICHVTGPHIFIGQSGLMQSDFTIGLNAGYPFSLFSNVRPESSHIQFQLPAKSVR